MKRFLLILLILANSAYAKGTDDPYNQTNTFVKYGIGMFASAKDNMAEVKTLSIGRQMPLGKFFIWQLEAGYWSDTRADMGRKENVFVDAAVGINVNISNSFYAQGLWGVAGLMNTDSYLGGHAQFNGDLGFGFKDKRGVSIGFNFKHISSAGIFDPNMGRDFGTIKLGIPW